MSNSRPLTSNERPQGTDPVDRIHDICIDAGGDKLTRIAAVLGYGDTPETVVLPRCQCGKYPFGTPPNDSVRIEDLDGVHYWKRPCQLGQQNAQKADEPRELTLHDFGYAPGNYSIKCLDCGQESLWCDKRARRCLTCAEQAMRENRTTTLGKPE